jgi:hypothetical protein
MNDFLRGKAIPDARYCAFLQFLIDRESVKPAGNADSPQQCHEKVTFGIALAIAVGQDSGGRDVV